MSVLELLLIAIGLSVDAFAVAICYGLSMVRVHVRHTLIIALFFGGFQAGMPLIGWLLGSRLAAYIGSVDHWVAFILLALIGGNMIRECFSPQEECVCGEKDSCHDRLDYRELFVMAVATSIDALAVGVTFAFLNVSILPAVSVIGITTFLLSAAGVVVGNFFGARFERRAKLTGGILLILLGTKILLEHLGILI